VEGEVDDESKNLKESRRDAGEKERWRREEEMERGRDGERKKQATGQKQQAGEKTQQGRRNVSRYMLMLFMCERRRSLVNVNEHVWIYYIRIRPPHLHMNMYRERGGDDDRKQARGRTRYYRARRREMQRKGKQKGNKEGGPKGPRCTCMCLRVCMYACM
jgi:hypothetical protein